MLRVVTGAPGSGKSTYVQQRQKPLDVVLDFDELAWALGSQVDHRAEPHQTVHIMVARVAWVAVWEELMKWRAEFPADVWIIHTVPVAWQMERYKERGAEIIQLPGKESRE